VEGGGEGGEFGSVETVWGLGVRYFVVLRMVYCREERS